MESILKTFQLSKQREEHIILHRFSFELYKGEVLGILGRSNSGKNTLCQILSGQTSWDNGKIFWKGHAYSGGKGERLPESKIVRIDRKAKLIPMKTIAQNLFLFRKHRSPLNLPWQEKADKKMADWLLREWDIPLKAGTRLEELSLGWQHVIETLKAVLAGAEVLLFEEAFIFYSDEDYRIIQEHLKRLCTRGITIMVIDTRMSFMMDICDRILLIQEGWNRGVFFRDEFSEQLFLGILGGNPEKTAIRTGELPATAPIFSALIPTKAGKDVAVNVWPGEIVGLVEMDAERLWAIAVSLAGLNHPLSFPIYLEGERREWKNYSQVQQAGIEIFFGYSDEFQWFPGFSVSINYSIPILNRVSNAFGIIQPHLVRYVFQKGAHKAGLDQYSGKELISAMTSSERISLYLERLFQRNPKLLVVYDYGQALDFVLRNLVFQKLNQEAKEGRSILILANNHLEITDICHRIYRL